MVARVRGVLATSGVARTKWVRAKANTSPQVETARYDVKLGNPHYSWVVACVLWTMGLAW